MTDAWFDNAIASDGIDGEGCRPEEALALKRYLRDELTLSSCCQKITAPTENSTDPGEPLLYLWGLMIDAMIELPNSQTKIVRLLCEIRTRPDRDFDKTRRVGALADPSERLWRDLPHFATQWIDGNWWFYCSQWRDEPGRYRTPEKVAQIPNIARADAQLAVADITGERTRFEGLARLCDTLEDSKAILDIEIFALREWIVNAGDMLFDMSKNSIQHYLLRSAKDFNGEVERGEMSSIVKDKRDLWHGEGGASLERWGFWKRRLEEIWQNPDLEEETREAARIALMEMNKADGSG